jgi:chromosome segregation ATPase
MNQPAPNNPGPIHQPMGQPLQDAARRRRKTHVQNIREVVDDLLCLGEGHRFRISNQHVKTILDELDDVTRELDGAQRGWNRAASQLARGRHARPDGAPSLEDLQRQNQQLSQHCVRLRQELKEANVILAARLEELIELRQEKRRAIPNPVD